MTRGIVSSLTLKRLVMIVLVFLIIMRLGHILIQIRPIRKTYLVKVMICQVGNIRVKRGRGKVWITKCIGIIVIIIHITKMSKQKQANK